MAAGSKERPPMLAPGNYAQWTSRFMRYVDTKPNKDQLKQGIKKHPYILTQLVTLEVSTEEEDIDALLDEESEILHSIEELFSKKKSLIPINPMDQEKTTFTCPFGTFAYMQMSFSLCNAPATFQSSFANCLNNLDKMLQRCKDANLVLNLEKCRFMVKEGIVLGDKVSDAGL
nr:hypothetical protein [Tanacetum cinerariifolium]